MLVGIYSPYLDTFGGGERYILTIAELFSKDNQVEVLLDSNLQKVDRDDLKRKLEKRLDLDLSKIEFIDSPFGAHSSFIRRNKFLKKYDLLFAVTDGSIFYSTARKSFLHIQSPLPYRARNFILGKVKLLSWKGIIYNSLFTKHVAETTWKLNGFVVYPPVDIDKFKVLPKKKQIVTVGRFFGYLKSKKHEVLIDAFKEIGNDLKGWSFHLAGSASEGDLEYVDELKKRAKGFEIYIHPNLSFPDLVKLYGESSIYWHSAGFGEEDPTRLEHFGITTVEAMASGCVPVVIKKGGQVEIVEEGVSGLFWENIEQLKEKTFSLIEDEGLLKKFSESAQKKSKEFSKARFEKNILEIINS